MGHANEPVQLGSGNLDTCRPLGADQGWMRNLAILQKLGAGLRAYLKSRLAGEPIELVEGIVDAAASMLPEKPKLCDDSFGLLRSPPEGQSSFLPV